MKVDDPQLSSVCLVIHCFLRVNLLFRKFVGCGGPKLTGGASGRGVLRRTFGPGQKKKKKETMGINIGSPSHFRGVWASPATRREAPSGRTTPRLPGNDWGKVLLACTCVMSHATYKKKAGRDGILARSVSLIFAILTLSLKRPGSIWAAGGLISQSAFVNP